MALIHTFIEDFNSISEWEDFSSTFGLTGMTFAASGGKGVITAPGSAGTQGVAYRTTATYTVVDSWMSIDFSEFDTSTSASLLYNYFGASNGSTFIALVLKYLPATNQVSFVSPESNVTLATISNPGGTITLGIRMSGTTAHYFHSLNAGTVWTYVGSYDYSAMANISAAVWKPMVIPYYNNYTACTPKVDNLNAHEPPVPPLAIAVATGVVTTNADPRVRLIIGDNLVVDLSAVTGSVVTTAALPYTTLRMGLIVNLTAVSSAVTTSALPYVGIAYGPYYVTFTPAIVRPLVVPPLSIDLSERDPIIYIYPEVLQVLCVVPDPFVGTLYKGDPFGFPWTVVESGTQNFDMTNMTADVPAGGSLQLLSLPRTQWVRYSSPVPATLTLNGTSTANWAITHYEEDELSELTFSMTSPLTHMRGIAPSISLNDTSPFVIDVNSGYTYFSLHSNTSNDISLTWTYVPSNPQLLIECLDHSLDRTPETLNVAVQGADLGESVRFTWSPPTSDLITSATTRPITLATITSDPEGNIYIGSIPIPAVYHGTYEITATGVSSGKIGIITFVVEYDPLPQDSFTSDVIPVASTSVKWLWDDGAGVTWIMPKNPDRMLSIIKSKILLAERSTSGNGQHIIWQGATPALDWGFSGTVTSQVEFDKFEYFYNLNRKFYITDHRNRVHTVTFKSLDLKPRRNEGNFWTFDYDASLYLFSTGGS